MRLKERRGQQAALHPTVSTPSIAEPRQARPGVLIGVPFNLWNP